MTKKTKKTVPAMCLLSDWLPVPSFCTADSAPLCPTVCPLFYWLSMPSLCTVDSAPLSMPPVGLVICSGCLCPLQEARGGGCQDPLDVQ